MKVSSEFTPEHSEFFEDGIDFVADPVALGGHWRDDWYREIQKRIELSDFIGLITVKVLRIDTDPDRQTSFRLIVDVDRELQGGAPKQDLSLVTRQGEMGYDTVKGKQQQILNKQFMAFIKWYQTDDGIISAHWHLSPASDPIMSQVYELLERKKEAKSKGRVIVHTD